MGKQHQTFPGEPEEMPDKKDQPEIIQPDDPKEPEIPEENPDDIPIELPPDKTPGEDDKPVVSG
jgi:hypothetical protein